MAWTDEARPYGPVKLANGWTVEVDPNVCIGAAPCTAIAMKAFALDENGKAAILSTADEDDKDTILNAAKACPVAAVIIEDETRKLIFPL